MKNAAKVAIPILLLFMLPSAMGTFEIQQGPSAIAASPGATAWGGKMQFTDPDGNTQDGNYFALMGLTAIAFVPDGEQDLLMRTSITNTTSSRKPRNCGQETSKDLTLSSRCNIRGLLEPM